MDEALCNDGAMNVGLKSVWIRDLESLSAIIMIYWLGQGLSWTKNAICLFL